MKVQTCPLALAVLGLAGCASTLSGVGGSDQYACKAPQGVLCTSISGVYANSVVNNLPAQRTNGEPKLRAPLTKLPARTSMAPASDPGARSAPRVLRLWIAPWEDSDGDLNEQGYVDVLVDTGRWLIEHERPTARNCLSPIAPPGGGLPGSASDAPKTPDARTSPNPQDDAVTQ